MGRNRQPTAIKEARNNPGKRRMNEWEPIPPKGEIHPPPTLEGESLEVWNRQAPIAIAMRTLTTADVTLFAIYCEAVAEYAMLQRDFRKMFSQRQENIALGEGQDTFEHPWIRNSEAGGTSISQVAYYRDTARKTVIDIGDRFGMSSASRTKINVKLGDGLAPNVRPTAGSREAKQEGVLAKVVGGEVAGRNRLSIG
jgi:P27 family predicted phage terminase small subunit